MCFDFAGLEAVFKTKINDKSTISHNFTLHLLLIVAIRDRRHVKQLQAHNYPLVITFIVCFLDEQCPKLFSPAHERGRRKQLYSSFI